MSSFVQGNSATSGGTQTNIVSAAFSSNNAAGNFLVCAVRYFVISIGGGITGVTDSQGNTWVRANGSYQDGASDFVSFWYATNCKAGANTVTFTGGSSSAFPRICIAEYNTTLQTEDLNNHAAGTTSTSFNSGNISPAVTENLFGFVQNNTADSQTYTPAVGWTFRESPDGNLSYYDQLDAVAGTYAFSGTIGSSVEWNAMIVSFKGAVATGVKNGLMLHGSGL